MAEAHQTRLAVLYDGGRIKTDADELSIMETVKVDILKGWDVSATYNFTSYNWIERHSQEDHHFRSPDNGESQQIPVTELHQEH